MNFKSLFEIRPEKYFCTSKLLLGGLSRNDVGPCWISANYTSII